MKYDLKQYGCTECGALTEVLDFDQPLPKGWTMISRMIHLCPECSKTMRDKYKNEEDNW
ncbi:MAG: hypothetical protein J6X18_17740 [Bacteroidales bacterium]|nr:hypothetical protein [Bacteroidales bacterium]